jgi:tungstate transport system substrate-binding protein
MQTARRRVALRVTVLAAVLGLAVPALAVSRGPAQAGHASTLTVVGTSDVFDANLVQSVLKPGFEAAHPQYKLNYVSKGTGAAIAFAEAGTASALLVHAASLENQFVAQGYSAEQYGRAIFWGDYVLIGPSSDPAGVLTNAPHDIVAAFQRVAAAGAAGTANFVSRGGTPGTTVREHAIWALTSGVTTCTVSDANGAGTSPSTTTGACPSNTSFPSWYHATGLTQGPNIVNGDACNYSGGSCYLFTDRGTFTYLQSTGAIGNNLKVLTRATRRPRRAAATCWSTPSTPTRSTRPSSPATRTSPSTCRRPRRSSTGSPRRSPSRQCARSCPPAATRPSSRTLHRP